MKNPVPIVVLFVAVLACASGPAQIGPPPSGPIRFILPAGPGADVDRYAEPLAAALSISMAQPVQIDRRPGLDGALAAEIVAKSVSDGRTWLLGSIELVIAGPRARSDTRDPLRELKPVTLVAIEPNVLVFGTSMTSANTVTLLRRPTAGRGEEGAAALLSYAYVDGDGVSRLSAERLLARAGAIGSPRRYRDRASALQSLANGDSDFMFAPLSSTLASLEGRRLRPFAVAAASRLPSLPSVPTLAEVGMADQVAQTWYAIWAPADTPPAITQGFQRAVATALSAPSLASQWREFGAERGGQPVSVLELLIATDRQKWKEWTQRLTSQPGR